MTFPPGALAILQALYDKYRPLAFGSEDDRRALTTLMVETLAARIDPRFGCKKAGAGNPPSKDSLAYDLLDGTFAAWDWQNGATRALQIRDGQPPTYARIGPPQVFLPVVPTDHLGPPIVIGPTPTDGPPPVDPPPPADPLALAALTFQVAQLAERVGTLHMVIEHVALVQARGLQGTLFGYTLTLTPTAAK
jgi:hypothetical protein